MVGSVVVRQGSAIVIVNSTLSAALAGANEVAPPDPLLVIEMVFWTLTVWVPMPAAFAVLTLILPGVLVSWTTYVFKPVQVKESVKADPHAGSYTQSWLKSKESAVSHRL